MTPEKIGRYIVKREIGRGGMATVYQAYDPNFERDVAVKVLPRAFLHDTQFRARFEREAKTVAALEHPAIVPVYDFGEQDGQPFIVMRMMTGGDLGTRLREGPLSLDEAVRITRRLGEALAAAHRKDIIHRDLKPGNILFDQYGNAFLSDFGIARLAHGSHTLTGDNIIGTPAYMSPEQIQGEKDLDGRSDLYSLGIIFYHMLTGSPPYQATTPAKVMMMHILEPVPNLIDVRPELPPALEVWLERALAKEPEHRFANAEEMIAALDAAVAGQPHPTLTSPPPATRVSPRAAQAPTVVSEGAAPPPVAPPTERSARSRPWLPFVIGGGVLGVLIALGVAGVLVLGLFTRETPVTPSPLAAGLASPTPLPLFTVTPTFGLAYNPAVPTLTPIPPTDTPVPLTDTPTVTPTPMTPVVGGADLIAFVNDNDIWVMNVDGSDLRQLTNDHAEKSDLAWLPDGSALTYVSGKCIWRAEVESGRLDFIACFETAELLESFAVSPDGSSAAISVNRSLYIVPFDADLLQKARYPSHLKEISKCPAFAPLKDSKGNIVPVKRVRWSNDGKTLSVMLLAQVGGGLQGDLIRIYPISDCKSQPYRTDEFPAQRFQVDNFNKTPYLQNFGYDGGFLYAMTSYTRNDGYGHLYLYNADLHRADIKVNPIDDSCCYRDPSFSPDGRYLIFAYQPYEVGAKAQLYLIPLATIGTGASYDPIWLPMGFFDDPRVKPQPVLRPAQTAAP
ncbi:MAG: hypothetical protein D6803_01415 [Anaerolineae bacterium]|nr:MAG: hypothetical protein D6803_01415 [Anaerolineae bacterium]